MDELLESLTPTPQNPYDLALRAAHTCPACQQSIQDCRDAGHDPLEMRPNTNWFGWAYLCPRHALHIQCVISPAAADILQRKLIQLEEQAAASETADEIIARMENGDRLYLAQRVSITYAEDRQAQLQRQLQYRLELDAMLNHAHRTYKDATTWPENS